MKKLLLSSAIFFVVIFLVVITTAINLEPTNLTFHFADGDVPTTVNQETIKVLFNPNELTIIKTTPWKHRNIQGADSPKLEFTSGEPFRLEMELFFDRYEERKDVREFTSKIEALANHELNNVSCLVRWSNSTLKCELESFQTKYVFFLDEGTPVRAVMNTVWKEFSHSEKKISPIQKL